MTIGSIEEIEQRYSYEREPQSDEIVYFTSTLYPDPKPGELPAQIAMTATRRDLALESLHGAQAAGHQIVIVDGGSSQAFLEAVDALGITVSRQQKKGMGSGRRQALLEASQLRGAKYLVWAEPEKVSFVDFIQRMGAEMAAKDADIGMPTRDPELFERTYPDYQVASERRAAKLINGVLHREGITDPETKFDFFFGPKIMRNDPEVVKLFTREYQVNPDKKERRDALVKTLQSSDQPNKNPVTTAPVKPDDYSNVLFFPIFAGLLDKDINVVALDPIPFRYPAAQKADETNFQSDEARELHTGRREAQLYGILAEALHFSLLNSQEEVDRDKSILERVA